MDVDRNIWHELNRAHNAFTNYEDRFPSMAWKNLQINALKMMFVFDLKKPSARNPLFGPLRKKITMSMLPNNHSWDLNQIKLSPKLNVSSGLGNYMENLRFARVPRLKGESKATPQAANTLKISWEPNRTCPPNKCNIWLLDDNLLYWRWSDSLLSPSPVHTQRRVP